MASSSVTSVILKNFVPSEEPKLSDFEVKKVPAPSKDQLKDEQVIVKPMYLSIDPYLRFRLMGSKDTFTESYVKGEAVSNILVGEIVASCSKEFKEGDMVLDNDGKWQTEYITNSTCVSRIPSKDGICPRDFVGVFSMPAYTAYYGTVILGKPKPGETILVSAASGAVGQMVVQIAKAKGLFVVGAAGSDEKVEYVKQLGADAAFNYKTCGKYADAIHKAAPNGVDIYFDNVGGEFLDAALANINVHARVVICGAISQYNVGSPDELYGVKNMVNVMYKKVTVTGFIIFEHFNTPEQKQFFDEISKMYVDGKIKYKFCEKKGLENAPQALLDQLAGKNIGKTIVKI
ncbi:hypothetical protein H4R99_003201 [Coemansia sp. RSA 1722]|nr:hypothetical protein H4R99_003201 [Coemansia sp. RSA 1722]